MSFDVTDNFFQQLIEIIYIVFFYIVKITLFIGILFTTEKIGRGIIAKKGKNNFAGIGKGLLIILFSLVFYFGFLASNA